MFNPGLAFASGMLGLGLVFVVGAEVGLSDRLLWSWGAFAAWFIISWSAYSLPGNAPIHGVDLDRRGRPRGDRAYRGRSRDPVYRMLHRDPALPLPVKIRLPLVLVSAAAMSAVVSFVGTRYEAAAVIVAFAAVLTTPVVATVLTHRRRRKLTATRHP